MITYQVKITINQEVETAWLHWMKTVHVPDVIATGLVRSFQILRPQEDEAQTYYFHYQFDQQADFERYTKEFGPKLRQDVMDHYANQFEASRQLFDWI